MDHRVVELGDCRAPIMVGMTRGNQLVHQGNHSDQITSTISLSVAWVIEETMLMA